MLQVNTLSHFHHLYDLLVFFHVCIILTLSSQDGKSEDAVKYARMKLVKFFAVKSFETLLQVVFHSPLACLGY